MWRRRHPADAETDEEPPASPESSDPLASSTPPQPEATEAAEATVGSDDPYAQLENFFNEPIILEDPGAPAPDASAPAAEPSLAPLPPPPLPAAEPRPSEAGSPPVTEAIQRLEQFAQRLAARFEALEAQVRDGSAQTLESLRRLGERTGAELAMLDKRAVNLELTMARLRATTEALELSLRKLPDFSSPDASSAAKPSPEPSPEPSTAVPSEDPTGSPSVASIDKPNEPRPADSPDALFTLEEEVPASEWDEPPRDETEWP